MGGNILTKEKFVELVMKEQERKKESGIKLEKISNTSFYNLLTDILLEMGEGYKKETPKSTEIKETKKKVRKQNKIVIEQIVVNNEDLKTDLDNDIVFDSEVVQVLENEKTNRKTKKAQKIEMTKVINKVTKVKKEKAIEPIVKTKEVTTKNGLIQLAFDFGF